MSTVDISNNSIDDVLDEYPSSKLTDLWISFLTRYYKRGADKSSATTLAYYHDMITNRMEHGGITSFNFDYNDLNDAISLYPNEFQDLRVLEQLILRRPDDAIATLTDAVLSILSETKPSYTQYLRENKFRADFTNIPINLEINEISSDKIGLFAKIEGVVIEYDDNRRTKFERRVFQCSNGHITEVGEFGRPKQCSGMAPGTGEIYDDCISKVFKLDDRRTAEFSRDKITIKLQQRSDKTPEGKRSPEILVDVLGKDKVDFVVNEIFFGHLVEISGIIRIREHPASKASALVGETEMYLEASSIAIKPWSALAEDDKTWSDLTNDLLRNTVISRTEKQDYGKLVNSIAPHLWFPQGDIVKEATLLLLVGSDTKKQPGHRQRGQLEYLLAGDPGVAKSELATWINQVKRRSIYNTGQQSSDVGLLGGMHKDHLGVNKIYPGAIELANGSVCIIDELGDRTERQQKALVQAMADNQRITIIKGGEQRDREIEVSFLCITNPSTDSMRYETNKPFYMNFKNIIPKLVSRFDLIIVMRDVADEYSDKQKIQTILKSMERSVTTEEFKRQGPLDFKKMQGDNYYPIGYMRRWIEFVIENYHPKITDSPDAMEELNNFYSTYRKMNIRIPVTQDKNNRSISIGEPDVTVPSIDLRKSGAFVRLTEAHARACHRNNVIRDDALAARHLLEASLAVMGFDTFMSDGRTLEKEDNMAWLTRMARRPLNNDQRFTIKQYKTFNEELEKISWITCTNKDCRGVGFYKQFLNEPSIKCDVCNGTGVLKISFSKEGLEEKLRDRGISTANFTIMWKDYQDAGLMVKDKIYPDLWNNTRTHVEHFDKESWLGGRGEGGSRNGKGDLKNLANESNAHKMLEQKGMEPWQAKSVIDRNPDLWKKLNKAVEQGKGVSVEGSDETKYQS